MSLGGYSFVHNQEQQGVQDRFEAVVQGRLGNLDHNLSASFSTLQSIEKLIAKNERISASDFRAFVAPVLKRHPEIHAFEWIPRVSAAERPTFVDAMQKNEFPKFEIMERRDGVMVPASKGRAEYFPVHLVEPFEANRAAHGYDLGSSAVRFRALQSARDSGKMISTQKIVLVQETKQDNGFLVFKPVYKAGSLVTTIELRRKNLLGFVLGVFRVSDLIEAAGVHSLGTEQVQTLGMQQIQTYVFDESAPKDEQVLYPKSDASNSFSTIEDVQNLHNFTCKDYQLALPARTWRVVYCPSQKDAGSGEYSLGSWSVLILGLSLTLLGAAFVYVQVTKKMEPDDSLRERSKGIVFIALIILVGGLGASSWFTLSRIEGGYKADVEKSLTTALGSSQQALRVLYKNQKSAAKIWAASQGVVKAVEQFLETPRTPDALKASPAQSKIRAWLKPVFRTIGYRGFFIIDSDGVNLSSSRDSNTGTINLLVEQQGFLDKIWSGQTLLSLPQASDVPLMDVHGEMVEGLATMFVASPIYGTTGEVIALLAFRIEPDVSFTSVFERGRFGETGETYAFDSTGLMLSESLFSAQLFEIGLISNNKHSDLQVHIRNPGVNLVAKEKARLPRDQQPLTYMAQSAIKGEAGLNLQGYQDYRGVPVVGAWVWDRELGFGIATEIDAAEAFATFEESKLIILTFSGLSIFFLLVLTTVFMRSQKKLIENEVKYSTSINSTSEGYWLVDTDGRMLEVNDAFCSMLGRTREELIGHRPPEFASEESRALHELKTSQIAVTDQRTYEINFISKQGELVYSNVSATTVRDKQGNASSAFAFITNITKRKDAERERDFQKFALDEHAIVSIADVRGNITYANDKFCEISGYTHEELLGQNHRLLKSGEHSDEFFADLWKTISSGRVWRGNIKNRKKGGGYYWVDATIVPFTNEKGKPFQYVAIRTDITGRMDAIEEAERANRAKSEFLSSMSHELRTPMNAILGFGQMLECNPKEPLSESQSECVGLILKGGQHLLELINDILDLAKIESGKVELAFEDISPLDVIKDCLPLITDMAADRGIHITVPDESESIIKVSADYTRLKQVLLNLMSNAVKYNRDNGSIMITLEESGNNKVRIYVTDTGDGLSAEDQEELFKPFNRLGAEHSEIEGTGIGLVVCKDLMTLMHGFVGVNSELGKGSEFWVELPRVDGGVREEGVVVDGSVDGPKEDCFSNLSGTMLYVEDNPGNLKLMEMIISNVDGLNMITTETGEMGVELARTEQPDIIILDINLPGLNGIETLKELGKYDNTKDIPVLALSASATKEDIQKGLDAGFLRYLTKPLVIDEVLEAIKATLETTK